jgi:hypothetical protein
MGSPVDRRYAGEFGGWRCHAIDPARISWLTPSGMSDNPLREGDVVGRFRRGLMIDIGTVVEVIPATGGAQPEKIRWARQVEPRPSDGVERIPV